MTTKNFFAEGTPKQFEWTLEQYDQALRLKAENKSSKPENVIKLDKWYQNELPKKIKSRGKDAHLVHDELVQTIKWKLARGKFRPNLVNLVQMNTPRVVMQETKKAFRKLQKTDDLQGAANALCNVKGVGPAMASAVLAAGAPQTAPFMADECLLAMPDVDGLDYTMKEYMRFVDYVKACVERLNSREGASNWTPHKVELAVWTHYILRDLKPEVLDDMPAAESSKASPIKPAAVEPSAEPAAAEPAATEPVIAEPAAPEPVVAEPSAPEPVVTETPPVEPAAPKPVVSEPAAPEPVVAEPAAPEPVVAEPAASVVAEPVVIAEPASTDSNFTAKNGQVNDEDTKSSMDSEAADPTPVTEQEEAKNHTTNVEAVKPSVEPASEAASNGSTITQEEPPKTNGNNSHSSNGSSETEKNGDDHQEAKADNSEQANGELENGVNSSEKESTATDLNNLSSSTKRPIESGDSISQEQDTTEPSAKKLKSCEGDAPAPGPPPPEEAPPQVAV